MRKWLRNIHRDLGYFFVGIVLIYGISGILLNHKITAYSTDKRQVYISSNLNKDELASYWKKQNPDLQLKNIMSQKGGMQLYLQGGIGHYISSSGQLNYETYDRSLLIDFVHRLHYNTIKGWKYMADFFAISLVFFAISGLFLSRGKHSFSKRGKWFTLIGLIITCVFFFC